MPVVAAGLGFSVGGPGVGVGAGLAVVAARAIRTRRAAAALAGRRDEQLADAMGAMVSALRAGMSLPQALAYTAEESEPPLRDELLGFVHDVEVGVPLADVLRAWADRVGSEDARLVAATMELHRRVGGDLPVVLAQVAGTLRERVSVAREVRALTAQARLSGGILGALPIGFFVFLWLTSRSEMQASISSPAGIATVVIGLTLDGLAFLWIRRLLEVA
jgi:tight adherence protein B